MKLMKIVATLMVTLMLAALPALTLAEDAYGSAAVTAGQTYTLEQMLTLAIQDEYMAQAEYAAILNSYGTDNAFANIIKAEGTHIALLKTLFETYGFTLPADTAADKAVLPASLVEAYTVGVAAENANIAMYEAFLAQSDLPDDVRGAFVALQNASRSHLTAFTRNADKDGLGLRNGRSDDQDGRNSQNGNGNGNGNGGADGDSDTAARKGARAGNDTCPLYDATAGTCAGCDTQRSGRGRNAK
ncbi:MAG: hypothetical protein GX418_10700 [Clostridiales bacterium]|nr:hypothetical protein [Clostridiales bacterium]